MAVKRNMNDRIKIVIANSIGLVWLEIRTGGKLEWSNNWWPLE
jgi:hypothetical protein